MNIEIMKTIAPKEKPAADRLGFGRYFTDHMLLTDYEAGRGWHDARIVPFGPLTLHPAATVFHYGAEIFEELKAYRRPDGEVQLFRPWENVRRLNHSAERMALPQLDAAFALQAIKTLARVEKEWVPDLPRTSLYLRPFLLGNDETLGVHTVRRALFAIIASPVGAYYAAGLSPVSIMIETRDVRAVRGGTGYAKCGGNYGASMRAGESAAERGYDQVLWLDGVERRYVEEVGSMNVMFLIGDTVVTPALTGSVLPGITRMSCIELLREKGYRVEERLLSTQELLSAAQSGALREAWGCGTAAVVSPIGALAMDGARYTVADGGVGKLTRALYDTLTDIQWGRTPDTHGWTCPV